jgi:hypothetical protein
MRQYSSVDRVGFRQSARGARKVPYLAGLTTATGNPPAANSLAAAIS